MNYHNLIGEICKELNIDFKIISKDWVMVLTKGNKTKCISGYKFPLNDNAISNVLDDKYALYDLCKLKNIPIIEHSILFNPHSKLGSNTQVLLNEYFQKYQKDVVIKPNNGTEGTDIYHITKFNDLVTKANELFKTNFSISICPFYDIEAEYRVIVLDAKVELIFEKERLEVIGDGIKTVKDLLMAKNPNYFQNIELSKAFNTVLPLNEKYTYDWRYNLSKGATAKYVDDINIKNILRTMALDVTKKIGANFVSVDIVKCNDTYMLMEINSGVCINKVTNFIDKDLKTTKRIYKKAILKMFSK